MRELLTKYVLAMITASIAKYIDAYNEFLIQRKAIKEQIQLDWNNK